MGHRYHPKVEAALARKPHTNVPHSGSRGGAHTHPLMKLQHTIGNQAVQRLIGSNALQRAPDTKTKEKGDAENTASLPSYVAKIVFQRAGEVKGNSLIPGHEGKVEIQSLNFETSQPSFRRREDKKEPPPLRIILTRTVDDLSQIFMRATHEADPVLRMQFETLKRDKDGKVQVAHTFSFSDGIITSYNFGGGGIAGKSFETIELEFKKGSF